MTLDDTIFENKKDIITAKEARKIAGGLYDKLSDTEVKERIRQLEELSNIVLSTIKFYNHQTAVSQKSR